MRRSAFAPDFKELEENEEYSEREDEFDIVPQAEVKAREEVDEEHIDILTIDQTELEHIPDADDDERAQAYDHGPLWLHAHPCTNPGLPRTCVGPVPESSTP